MLDYKILFSCLVSLIPYDWVKAVHLPFFTNYLFALVAWPKVASFLYASTHLSENRTLSPMNSFSSELGVQFGTCLEAPHVIDVDLQVWMPFSSISPLIGFGLLYYYCSYGPSTVLQVLTSVISTGPDNYPLNASYKTADGYAFQVSSAFCHIDFDCLRVVSSFIVQ